MSKTAFRSLWHAPFRTVVPRRLIKRTPNGAGDPGKQDAPASQSPAMRILMFLFLAATLTISANTYAQKVTLSAKALPLEKVLTAVEKQTGLVFFYNRELLANSKPVTITAKDMPLNQFLPAVLNEQSLNYRLEGKTITLSRKPSPAPARTTLAGDSLINVSGIVTTENGEPIPGVSVQVKGGRIGGITDPKGIFHMKAPQGQVLVISAIGFQPAEVRAQVGEQLSVKLALAVTAIKDHVVTGIYQRKKESFTGSAATYTVNELKMVGNQSPLQALKTLDPAFAIVENTMFGSDPNRLPDVEIRGKSSVIGLTEQYGTNPNQPLFILDGFETTLQIISDFTMDRIESITLLKDAAATAIYGSKAANGVVVIETKRPMPGKLRINYNVNTSFNFADLSDYNLMSAAEKLEFEKMTSFLGSYNNITGRFATEEGETRYNTRLAEVQRGVNSYWMNEPLRFGINHRHTLIAEGGDNNLRYAASISYGQNQGVMKESNRNLTNGNVRLIYRKDRLSVSNSLSIDLVNATRESIAFSEFSRANPYFRKYNSTGGIDKVLASFVYGGLTTAVQTETYYNPVYDLHNNNVNKSSSQGFTNNLEIEWRLMDELRARVRAGVMRTATTDEVFRSPFNSEFAQIDPLLQGRYTETNNRQLNYDGDLSLTYGKLFAEKHMLNVVAGMRLNQVSADASGFAVSGFVSDEFPNASFGFGYMEGSRATYRQSVRRSASYFLNTGYAFDERFLLDATLRSDGASVFGANRQFTNIWSTGFAWNIHKEAFLQDYTDTWLNSLRLRASVGNPGNQNFSDYISMRVYGYNNANPNPFGPSVIVNNHGNPSLKWQKTLDRNLGMDVQVFKNRLRVTADYFLKTTDPLLVFVQLPSSSGSTTTTDNFGGQEQKGFTLTTNYTAIQRKGFTWILNLNARHLKSKYMNFGNALSNFNEKNKGVNMVRYYDGASPSDLWAVRSLGIDPATGREMFLDKNGNHTFIHNYSDEKVVGNSDPKVEGIMGTMMSYKGFSANIAIRYRYGGQIFMQTLYDKVENIPYQNLGLNQDRRALTERWQKPGDQARFKAITEVRSNPMSSRFVEDNNILAGESISVGYEATQARWLQSIGASSLTFRAYMNDIFRLSTVKNERGIDYPFARSVSFSAGVRF
ncbi:SusC/RagA family TonB-linked outer membrane protein [uncultured Chitinophaga sp.]|uniref:SusC/RagA family TonB-linked outer membrane protein n=1 Tax=uncultured Chitinophaga sp. TaxID=339340 RepID=UPI0025CF3EE0|nr:SusC/RagA family TonB-linked outer membrane protein [uncultured Chitinophaga sp.]